MSKPTKRKQWDDIEKKLSNRMGKKERRNRILNSTAIICYCGRESAEVYKDWSIDNGPI